jgi:UDP-N-acetylglucosamine 2-epimerase (non-hydrolysing)
MNSAEMRKPKLITILGTRPELIRLSRIIPALDQSFDHVLVHTGQNKDRQLNEIFFEELGIRTPDYYLNVDTSSLATAIGEVFIKSEKILAEIKPNGMLVLGDTNSAFAAVLAERMQIPVYHMEAGNRSFDANVPEELNRKIIDHASSFNLPYTQHAKRNLLAEGLDLNRICVTGSPMREVIDYYLPKINESKVIAELKLTAGEYFLVSAHRQENVDSPERLQELLDTLIAVQTKWNLPVLVSMHPRTRKQLNNLGISRDLPGLIFHEPFGFFDYINLQIHAKCVLSDSGTISEESLILDFPAVTIRDSMERPEALENDGIILAGITTNQVISAIEKMLNGFTKGRRIVPTDYLVAECSVGVVNYILSTIYRHHEWAGLRAVTRPE